MYVDVCVLLRNFYDVFSRMMHARELFKLPMWVPVTLDEGLTREDLKQTNNQTNQ